MDVDGGNQLTTFRKSYCCLADSNQLGGRFGCRNYWSHAQLASSGWTPSRQNPKGPMTFIFPTHGQISTDSSVDWGSDPAAPAFSVTTLHSVWVNLAAETGADGVLAFTEAKPQKVPLANCTLSCVTRAHNLSDQQNSAAATPATATPAKT